MKQPVGHRLLHYCLRNGTGWIFCLIVLCSISVALCGKMGHVESLSLKESVIRNHNGVMVMTLSPRRTVLSLNNGKSGFHGHKPRRQKPTVMFSKTFAPPSDTNDNEELFDNQTETVPNPTGSSEQALFVDNQQDQAKHKDLNDNKEFASTNNDIAHYHENENESQASQSALRNISIEADDNISSYNMKPEIGQVWSNEEMADVPVSDEDNDFHAMIAGFLKREIWTIPLFVFASLNLVLITFFEIYVLCRTRGQSRRHLFLGQMLLFGLFLSSSLALLFAICPSVAGCFVGRLGVGIAYSLIFAVLMVKCMFLLSLDVGVYLPTSYQACLLFFAVLVQVAIDTQWTILFPPVIQEADGEGSLLLQCGTTYSQLLYSLSYIAFLIVVVGILSAKATFKGITENFRESIYILMSIIVSIPIAISWTVAGWILQGRHQDACVAFGLVAQSLTVFLIMFMPKGRQLAAMGKEGYAEDQDDDQCSGYSPSFFHFKPTSKSCKTTIFGDGNLYTTLEPTLSTINPNVFFHRPDYHSGMIY